MKKYINFRNFGIVCFAVIIILLLCSYTGNYDLGSWRYKVESVTVNGHSYIIAVSNGGHIAVCPAK